MKTVKPISSSFTPASVSPALRLSLTEEARRKSLPVSISFSSGGPSLVTSSSCQQSVVWAHLPYGPRFGSPWLTSREKESSTWAKRERRRTPAGLAEEWDEKGWRLERGNRLISLSLGLESLSLLSTHSNSDRRERGPFHDERKVIGRDPAVTRISEIKSYIYYPYPRCFRSLFVPLVSHFTHHSLREAARRDKDNKFKVLHGCSWRTWCSEWRTRRKEGTEGTIRMTSGRTCMNDMISFL